jgi:hypothetical protein
MPQTTTQKTRRNPTQTLDALLTRIAQEHLFIDTLETRNSDSMDFHDVSVWGVKEALLAAYQAGLAASQKAA